MYGLTGAAVRDHDDGMTATAVGRNVAAELTRHRLSHAQLAAAVNMSETQIGRRVRGEVEFTATEIRAVAIALGVPVAALLGEVRP